MSAYSQSDPPSPSKPTSPHGRRRWRLALYVLAAWAIVAYLVIPWVWKEYFRHHPQFAAAPRITHTGDGHPGDPLNLALVGSDTEVVRALTAAGWYPADPITFESSVRIAVDSVFRRPDDKAPVSNLYLFDRKQDLAYEQPVDDNPRRRHHVRF